MLDLSAVRSSATILGRTGLTVSRVGLGASYGLGEAGVIRAVERGVNYLYWGSMRRPSFGRGIREAVRRAGRERLCIVIQSYSRVAALLGPSLCLALRRLSIEYADVLLLGWWNREPSRRILEAGRALVERGLVRHLGVSTHERPLAPVLAREGGPYGVLHVRYNAAHRGAERDIFPFLPPSGGPGIVAFTATRWGTLLARPRGVPADAPWPTATDCYRFCLSDPRVHVVLAGPANERELEGALIALEKGPLDPEELAAVRRAGDAVYGRGWAPG